MSRQFHGSAEWDRGQTDFRVPRDVTFHALPSRVATIYPEWRSYKYILVKEQIVIVDPDTYEIVAVLEA